MVKKEPIRTVCLKAYKRVSMTKHTCLKIYVYQPTNQQFLICIKIGTTSRCSSSTILGKFHSTDA